MVAEKILELIATGKEKNGTIRIMRSQILTSELVEAYDRFLLDRACSLFYHSSKYKDFLKSLMGCKEEYILAMEGTKIHGVLPLMYAQVEGGRIYNSLPYYGSNGGIIADSEEAYRELACAYNTIARRQTTITATLIGNPLLPQGASGITHNYLDLRIGQWTALSPADANPEALMARINSSARRNVNKAMSQGFSVEIDCTQVDPLRQMHQDNMRAIGGRPKNDAFFASLARHFVQGQDYEIYVAKKDGVVIAALLLFYFNLTVEYFTPAVDLAYRTLQPLSLILITAMADAARRGFRWWNWGGTWGNQMGVYRFKRKWASLEQKYLYYTQLNDPSMLQWPRDRILSTFPNFFIVPFSALQSEEREP